MKWVVSTMLFNGCGVEEALREISRAGFNAVEVSHVHLERVGLEGIERVVRAIEEAHSMGIDVAVAHLPAHEEATIVRNVDEWERCYRLHEVFVEKLSRTGLRVFVLHTLLVKPANSMSAEEIARASFRASREMLRELSFLARDLGVVIAVENRVEKYAVGNTLRDLLTLIEDLENVALCIDVGHAHASGFDVVEFVELSRNHAVVYHLHDNDGSRDQHLPPYLGSIPWEDVVERLSRDAYVVLEVSCRGSERVCRSYARYLRMFVNEMMNLQRAEP